MTVAPGIAIYWFSRLPFKLRLTAEILILIILIAVSSWVWRDQFCDGQATRAADLSQRIAEWAEESHDAVVCEKLNYESHWFRRAEGKLRRRAFWLGFCSGPLDGFYHPYADDWDAMELGVLEVMERHERIAQRLHDGKSDETEDP